MEWKVWTWFLSTCGRFTHTDKWTAPLHVTAQNIHDWVFTLKIYIFNYELRAAFHSETFRWIWLVGFTFTNIHTQSFYCPVGSLFSIWRKFCVGHKSIIIYFFPSTDSDTWTLLNSQYRKLIRYQCVKENTCIIICYQLCANHVSIVMLLKSLAIYGYCALK